MQLDPIRKIEFCFDPNFAHLNSFDLRDTWVTKAWTWVAKLRW